MTEPTQWAGLRSATTPIWIRFLITCLLVAVAVEVFFSVPALAWSLLKGEQELPVKVGIVAAVCVLVGIFVLRRLVLGLVGRVAAHAAAIPAGKWFAILLLVGIGLRLGWVLAFPAPAKSDALTYLNLSKKLLAGEPYESAGTRAFWPPGYPFFLMPWLKLPLSDLWAVVLSNLVLFAATLATTMSLTRRFAGESAARMTGLLIAIWPNLVTQAGLASKEGVVVLLLPLILLVYGESWGRTLLAGLLLGAATLIQPSLQLFFLVLVAYEVARRAPWRTAALRIALVIAAMAVVIAPWTIRNHRVFGEFVLVSTNGGSTLYRANNPLATGGYEREGEKSFEGYSEVECDRLGYKWTREWVKAHPGEFLRLAARKHVLFLGDDAVGVYETLKRGLEKEGMIYAGSKALVNGIWLLLWALIFASMVSRPGTAFAPPLAAALATGFLYFYAIHSVFESAGKYHVPALGLLLTLGGALAVGSTPTPVTVPAMTFATEETAHEDADSGERF